MNLVDFWNCSLWEFNAAAEGWRKANGQESAMEPPTEAEFELMLERAGLA